MVTIHCFACNRTWIESFFGGVTTAHGINQTFKEFNGPVRRLFWLAAFVGCIWALIYLGTSACEEFIAAITTASISTDTHDGLLPMITVCNLSKSRQTLFPCPSSVLTIVPRLPPGPIRCGCEAFYDPRIASNASLVTAVLPYLCPSVVTFVDSSWETLDAAGNVATYTILEKASNFINLSDVALRMSSFSSVINCDNGAYTKQAVVAKLIAGTLTYVDAFSYAGYAQRTNLVRGCEAVDSSQGSPTQGQKVPCMDDRWWGNVSFDVDYGACHTFNPCHGFPVDQICAADTDCTHYADKTLTGGQCVAGVCTCTRCAAGAGCRLAIQPHAGSGRGMRLVADVGTDQDPMLASPSNGRWNYGLLLDVHTQMSTGYVADGTTISPGTASQISLEQSAYQSAYYPFTNCSAFTTVAVEPCQANCLRRAQAVACCGLPVPDVQHGRLAPTPAADPQGGALNLSDPRLLCNLLNINVQQCFAQYVEYAAAGTVCVEGALGFTSPYFGGLWDRRNWYDTQDVTDQTGLGWQERASLAIARQCVWTDDQDSAREARYGLPCAAASDCPSSIGGKPGACAQAYRAYCPDHCDYFDYGVGLLTAGAMTASTVSTIAADELALATAQYRVRPNPALRWRPRCGTVPNGTACMNTADAVALVQASYALVDIDFTSMDETVNAQVCAGVQGWVVARSRACVRVGTCV